MKYSVIYYLTLLLVSGLPFVSFSQATEETFTDPRDGKVYKTVKIGEQVWLAENLRYNMPGTFCYKNSANNCERYGRLYDWNSAMKACAEGWHLPSDEEWKQLVGNYHDNNEAYLNLIKGGASGFDATLHGVYAPAENTFITMKEHGAYWSATEYDDSHAWVQRFLMNTAESYPSQAPKVNGQGCRCVKN